MNPSSSGAFSQTDAHASSANGFSRSRRNRSRRKKHSTPAENRQPKKQKSHLQRKNNHGNDTLPGFFLSKDSQKPVHRSVDTSFFADLKAEPNQPLNEDQNIDHLNCCYCHEPIRQMSLAIDVPDFAEPAHFDCVIKQLKAQEALAEGEEIIYIGNRKFAVVVYKTQNSFDLIREIPFEETRDFKAWRNEFSVRMRKQLE